MKDTRKQLLDSIDYFTTKLNEAKQELASFDASPENNTFPSIEEALCDIENKLGNEAFDDCQGAYNCGDSEYQQEFIVDGVHYIATLTVVYNRHDKTYYYIDGASITYRVKE